MSRSTRTTIATLLAAIASMLLVGATPKSPFDPLGAIPSGAIAVATIGDPSSLLANSIAFMRNSGLEKPAASLESFVGTMMDSGDSGSGDATAAAIVRAIDLSRRFVAALYPATGGATPVSALLFIPLRSGASADEEAALSAAIDEKLATGDEPVSVSMEYPGYLAIGAGGMDIPPYGGSGAMNLSRLAAYPASSLAVWGDPAAASGFLESIPGGFGSIMSGSDEEYESWSEDMPAESYEYDQSLDNTGAGIAGPETEATGALDNDQGDADYPDDFPWEEIPEGADETMDPSIDEPRDEGLARFGEAFKAGLDDVAGIELALTVQKDRVWFRIGAEPVAGGKLAAMAAKASEGDRSLPYLSWCEADALVSFAWSAPQDSFAPVIEAIYRLVLPDQTFMETAMDSMSNLAAASGPNGSASIGLDLSEELVQAIRSGKDLGDEEALALISRSLGLRVSGAMEIRDRQAFRNVTAGMVDIVKNPEYAALMAKAGLSFDIARKVGTVQGMPFDAYSYTFSATGETGMEKESALVALLGNLISPVYVYKDDKAFMGLGSPASVTEVIARGGARLPLRLDKDFKALRAGAPADTRALFYLSTKSLARLALRLMPESQEPLGFNINALSGMLGWFDATPESLGFGMAIGAEDIKAIVVIAD